jgi:poly [ADP-ribose] polymerase 7/11/12/13
MEMKRDLDSLHEKELEAIGAQVSKERRYWVKSGDSSSPDQDNNKLFIVQQGEELDEVEKKFKSTMPNATISRIERVQNQAMHQAFLLQLSTLKRQLKEWDEGTMRRKLWHGTEAVEAIVNSEDGYGFLPLLAGTKVGAKWGGGTYFARDARYSNDYARSLSSGQKQMLLCDVLVGQSAQGAQGMKMCPLLPGEKIKRYNSLVDSVDAPSIFVIQHSNQAYPSYLVTYQK